MTVSILFKIAAVGILITVLNQVLKHSGREDQAFLCSLAGLVLVLMWLIPYLYDLFVMMQDLFSIDTKPDNTCNRRKCIFFNIH